MIYIVIAFAYLFGYSQNSYAQTFTLDSTTLVADTVITGLNVPWELKYGPDDHLWMTEREGKVSRVNPTTGIREVILDASTANGGPVYQISESGMLGFTFHPQFPDSSFIYLVYTYRLSGNTRERMVKYTYDGDSLINPQTIIEGILGNSTHNGSRIIVGPDSKLYMTTGDAQTQPNAQNTTSVNGKVLRFNLDGTIPIDNPIAGSPVWNWGHRNAQGLAYGPTGILYSSEHGPNNDDEINIISAARNYGWPTVMGLCDTPGETTFCTDSNVVESIFNWTPTIAPADLVYYDHPSIPEWQGSLLLSVLKNKRLIRLTLNAAGDAITTETSYFINQWGRLRDICVGPDGTIYLATNGATSGNSDPNTHSIIRLRNLGYTAPILLDAGNDVSICAGDMVQLNAIASGGAPPLTYSWSPAAGLSCTTCLNPIASPASNTNYVVNVIDDNGNTSTDNVNISIVTLPGPITYTATILDTFGTPALIEFNINAPAADSVLVITNYYDTIGVFLNTQTVSFIDSTMVACTIGDGSCWIDFHLWVYAYSACGFDTLYNYQRIVVREWNSINSINSVPFSIYPNPSSGNIILSGLTTVDRILVVNAIGATVEEINKPLIQSGEYPLQLESLPAGVYFITIESAGSKGVQKLIKQ